MRQWLRHLGALDEIAVIHAVTKADGPGVMVDVGAHFGTSLQPFAADGWRVFAFEPDPTNRERLERVWGEDPNVSIDPRAITERNGELVPLFVSDVSSGITSITPFHPSHQSGPVVETVRLDTFLQGVDNVRVVKTDTEGWDLPVLRTFPWERLKPAAVLCEFEDRKTLPLGYDVNDLAQFMENQGYAVIVSEWFPVVEYGRRHRWRSLRRYPTKLSDPAAWGNLICVVPALERRVMSRARLLHRVSARARRVVARRKQSNNRS